jgi:hypothetical protein
MRVVAFVALGLLATGIVFGVGVGSRSGPDIDRYRGIRRV